MDYSMHVECSEEEKNHSATNQIHSKWKIFLHLKKVLKQLKGKKLTD